MSSLPPDPVPEWRAWAPGTRVVVRRALHDDPDHRWTDVVGEVVAVDDDGLVVAGRRGEVRVAAADVVAAKIVPPAPVRRPREG